MTPYQIADLLPLEWRQVMVDAGPYTALDPLWPAPRNAAGECPLGALDRAGLVRYVGVRRQPAPATAARALGAALGLPYAESYRAVSEFIRRWDRGEIADLTVALGLSEPAAAVVGV
jgi:hypothetical protein